MNIRIDAPPTAPRRLPGPARLVREFGGWESALALIVVIELVGFSQGSLGFVGAYGAGALSQLEQFASIGVAAVGLGLVVLTGGIDLSIGSVASLTGVVMARVWSDGHSIWVGALVGLVLAAAIGAVNGVIITFGRVDSLIVTLVTMFVVSSVAEVVVGQPKPYLFPQPFLNISLGTWHGIPYLDVIFAVLALAAGYVVGLTAFGRRLLMIGSSYSAAVHAGVRTRRVLIANYALCGLFAGVSGVLMSSLFASARADLADNLLLPALTAVVLGGVDIFGGHGRVRGIVLGVLAIGFLQQGLVLYGVNSIDVQFLVGVLLALGVVLRNLTAGEKVRRRLDQLRAGRLPARPEQTK